MESSVHVVSLSISSSSLKFDLRSQMVAVVMSPHREEVRLCGGVSFNIVELYIDYTCDELKGVYVFTIEEVFGDGPAL